MDKIEYSNLHHKTHYSCGQAIGSVEDSIKYAKELKLKGLAITDYCSLGSSIEAYNLGKKYDFPISIGCEINYYINGSENYNIVLIIKNKKGYRNICKLITFAYENLSKFKEPTCSIADLEDFSEGLICLTGGMNGAWGKSYLAHDTSKSYSESSNRIKKLFQIYKNDLYLEIVISNQCFQFDYSILDYEKKYKTNPLVLSNRDLIDFSEKTGIKTVITSDSVIPKIEDKILQDVCIRNSIEGKRGFYVRENRHICSTQELKSTAHLFGITNKQIDIMINNTNEVINKTKDLDLTFSDQIVDYPIITHPLHKDGMSKEDLVQAIMKDSGRLKENKEYSDRINYELDSIIRNGKINLIDYFLVIEDLCRACRDNGVTVGPGRGSGAGSLVNYCLKITHLDPIEYGLLFERFISQARILKGTYPDIDLDFSDQAWAKKYLIEKYGDDRVVPIGTMQTMRTKTAIKDAFKLYYPNVEFTVINNITTSFPRKEESENEPEYYERVLEESKEIRKSLFIDYPKIGECVGRLIGFNRQTGVHPCGQAITQDPINTLIPVKTVKGKRCLDFNLKNSEAVGVIKYDLLSLTTLRYISTAVTKIKERLGVSIDIYNIPINDQDVFNKFALGDTESVFQFNSEIARNILTKIKIESLDDLSLVTSVGRPGPMANQQHIEFIERKNGDLECKSPHESLNEVLKNTYGIMIYQESVMKASEILGGFSLAEADDIRKAMGKKKKEILEPYKNRFIKYAHENYKDIDEDRAEEIWHLMETFAGYGFNKSHAICYAYIGYICQYLKTYYPLEWWFGCLKHSVDKNDKFSSYFGASSDFVKLPDINDSTSEFYITKNNIIQMPFSVVKGIGVKANEEIYDKRPFSSFEDFFDRVNKRRINKTVFVRLIFSGAFDSFNSDREELLKIYFLELRKDKQMPEAFFNLNKEETLHLEQQSLDFIRVNYYEIYKNAFESDYLCEVDQLVNKNDGEVVVIGGKIKSATFLKTKKGTEYCNLIIDNNKYEINLKLWSDECIKYKKLLNKDKVIWVKGKVSFWMNKPQVSVTHLRTIEQQLRIAYKGENL